MKFRIDIKLGNDAMRSERHVAALLKQLASKLNNGAIRLQDDDRGDYPSGALRDVNGNKVGNWEVTED